MATFSAVSSIDANSPTNKARSIRPSACDKPQRRASRSLCRDEQQIVGPQLEHDTRAYKITVSRGDIVYSDYYAADAFPGAGQSVMNDTCARRLRQENLLINTIER
jgi:hypothetical protein